MKMWMVAVCVVLGLAACGTSGGGLRNDAYKLITEKREMPHSVTFLSQLLLMAITRF